jgi:hypothetical protein
MAQDDSTWDFRQDFTEGVRLGVEAIKQLTTLNAGSIVVIGTFLSNIFPSDKHGTLMVPWYIKLFIGLAFVGFGVSLGLATAIMFRYRRIFEPYSDSDRERVSLRAREATIVRVRVSWAFTLFAGGLISFGLARIIHEAELR